MAKFCDECPLVGDCTGEIENIDVLDLFAGRRKMGFIVREESDLIQISRCIDDVGNTSEIFQDVDAETVIERIEGCLGPSMTTKERFLLKPETIVVCGALNIRPNVLPWFKRQFEQEFDFTEET